MSCSMVSTAAVSGGYGEAAAGIVGSSSLKERMAETRLTSGRRSYVVDGNAW